MDANCDGVVTAEEARAALMGLMEPAALDQAVEDLVGHEGQVAYTTFMGQLLASKAADENRVLWREFRELDRKGTGYLDRESATKLLERPALAEMLGDRRDSRAIMALM